MAGLDVNDEGYLVLPKNPKEFLEGMIHNTMISIEAGGDPVVLIGVINQLTAAFLQDMDASKGNGVTLQ